MAYASGKLMNMYLDLAANRKTGTAHIEAGDLSRGDYYFGLNNPLNLNHVTSCSVQCTEVQRKKIIAVEFVVPTDPASFDEIGIKTRVTMNAEFNNETLLQSPLTDLFAYDVQANGVPAAAKDIAKGVKEMIENHYAAHPMSILYDVMYDETHSTFSSGYGAKLLIIAQTGYYDFEVYPYNGSPTIAVVQDYDDGVWSGDDFRRKFPIPDLLPGQGLEWFPQLQRCKNPCLIVLKNCTPACATEEEEQLLMQGKADRFDVHMWVDKDDADYGTFITALIAAMPEVSTCPEATCAGDSSFALATDALVATYTSYVSGNEIVLTGSEGLSAVYTVNLANGNITSAPSVNGTITTADLSVSQSGGVTTITIPKTRMDSLDAGTVLSFNLKAKTGSTACIAEKDIWIQGKGLQNG